MKRCFLFLFLLLLSCSLGLWAKPARQGMLRYVQPDGTVIAIQLFGDENGHFALDERGRVLEVDATGFYRLSALTPVQARMRAERSRRSAAWLHKSVSEPQTPTTGSPHVLTVLVEFKDLSFKLEKSLFQDMLCKDGFSEHGATGSVCQYFKENSGGQYSPVFDVFGPVKLSGNMAAYGRNIMEGGVRERDVAAEKALYEACVQLDKNQDIDFSQYDADGDGLIDIILFYFAGYDEAEGGSADAIWSHKWNVQYSSFDEVKNGQIDGVKLGDYFCTSELRGTEGSLLNGIGSTCHEFAHYLGLPDFYDTDGQTGGVAGGLYYYSLMSLGNYNNDGCTPPWLNTQEKLLLGWMQESELSNLTPGAQTLAPLWQNRAWISPTGTEGEYFLYECRDGKGWDAPLSPGLLIYHVDRSGRIVDTENELSAFTLWDKWRYYNKLNALGTHPCFYIIPSAQPSSLYYETGYRPGALVFPGFREKLCYEPIDWESAYTGYQLHFIGWDGSQVQCQVVEGNSPAVSGSVTSLSGEPLSQASVKCGENSVLSDADGRFYLPLEQGTAGEISLTVSREGYENRLVTLQLDESRIACIPVKLRMSQEAETFSLCKYDLDAPGAETGYINAQSLMAAVRYTPMDLAPYAGNLLEKVSFYPFVHYHDAFELYLVVDFGKTRVLTRKVEELNLGYWLKNTVDISDAGLRIPEGVDVYVGYAVNGAEKDCPIGSVYPGHEGNSYYSAFNLNRSNWQELYFKEVDLYMDLYLSADVKEVSSAENLQEMGYNWIDPGTGHYAAGERFDLILHQSTVQAPASVKWKMDGQLQSSDSVVLTAGEHRIQAVLGYADGRSEVLELEISVL